MLGDKSLTNSYEGSQMLLVSLIALFFAKCACPTQMYRNILGCGCAYWRSTGGAPLIAPFIDSSPHNDFDWRMRARSLVYQSYFFYQAVAFFSPLLFRPAYMLSISTNVLNSALFSRYSAAIAARISRREAIPHFYAISAIDAIARYSSAKLK